MSLAEVEARPSPPGRATSAAASGRDAWRRLRRRPGRAGRLRPDRLLRPGRDLRAADRPLRPQRQPGCRRGHARPLSRARPPSTGSGSTSSAATSSAGSSMALGSRCWSAWCRWRFGMIGGLLLGVVAGAFGGRVDTMIMRIVDIMLVDSRACCSRSASRPCSARACSR